MHSGLLPCLFAQRDRSEFCGFLASGSQNPWAEEALLTPDLGKRDPCFGHWALGNLALALLGPCHPPWGAGRVHSPRGCGYPQLLRLLSSACYLRTSAHRILSQPPGLATVCLEVGVAGGVATELLFGWLELDRGCAGGAGQPLCGRGPACTSGARGGKGRGPGWELGARVHLPHASHFLGAELRQG